MGDVGQLYVPLKFAQTTSKGEIEVEKRNETKNLKRTYVSVAFVGATCDLAGICPYKEKKKWRESIQYLHSRVDRARFWQKEGSILNADMVALRQEMERDAGRRQQKGTVVGYYSCGVVYPSRVQCGGNRNARPKRQRANWERLRDNWVIPQVLVQSLSSL